MEQVLMQNPEGISDLKEIVVLDIVEITRKFNEPMRVFEIIKRKFK